MPIHASPPRSARRAVSLLATIVLVLSALAAGLSMAAPAARAASSVQISAGGPAAAPFVADEDYSGGATAATTNTISTTGLTNPAPQSVYQHNRYGNFTYTIPGLTAGGSYTVRLHFAEEYWTSAGSRTFNVLINGTQVLTNFDIFATAGGEYKAVIEQFTATASSSGAVTIQFVTVKDNAQVNGIEVIPVASGEAPYGGTAAAVPGTVLAANYDTGGQGVAYNVTSVNGTANSYRSDGVDLEACTDTGCGDDIGWTAAGQWFKYTVKVATAATYTVSLRLAAPSAVTDGLHIANSAGTNLSGNINVPATGGWQDWTTVTATVTLPAGQQTLAIDQDNGGWNIHQLTFASSATPPGNTVTVASPGNQTGTVGTAASLQVSASDSASGQTLTYSATGLPAGLSISSSGLITGTPTTAATSTVTVTATDTTGAKGSASFAWTISSTAPPPSALVNGGFETGSLSPWVCQAGDAVVTTPVHSGTHAALISATNSQTGECDQTITLSPNTTYTLTGWTQGSYAYIGVSGGATASTWTSSSGWAQQTVSFTTGSSGTLTVFVHGWYAQGNVYADDLSVSS